jgi:hypothetical protein
MSRTITTTAGRDALPRRTVVYSADGTIAGRYDADRGVVLGDERTFPWSVLQPPIRILFCPTCDGRNRETLDMVCQTCGTDYGPAVSDDVATERARQDEKWGAQNHPDGTGPGTLPLRALADLDVQRSARWLAERAKSLTDTRFRAGDGTWRDILLEEVFEALAEDNPERLRTELVQVAAVAQQWAEAIDRRRP